MPPKKTPKEVHALSQSPIERDYTKEREDRCIPVAIKIMQIVAESGVLPEGILVTKEQKQQMYLDLMSKVTPILIENGIGFQEEIAYIFNTIGLSLGMLGVDIQKSHTTNLGHLVNNVFGEDDMAENTLTVGLLSDLTVRR